MFFFLWLNLRTNSGVKKPLAISKTVSKLRCFKSVLAQKLAQLKTKQLKKQIFNKMQWGVKEW